MGRPRKDGTPARSHHARGTAAPRVRASRATGVRPDEVAHPLGAISPRRQRVFLLLVGMLVGVVWVAWLRRWRPADEGEEGHYETLDGQCVPADALLTVTGAQALSDTLIGRINTHMAHVDRNFAQVTGELNEMDARLKVLERPTSTEGPAHAG